MGVTKLDGWDASDISTSYGLEPFVFNPGVVKTQEELIKEAEQKVQSDKRLNKALSTRKGEITTILQECLDKVNEQLERGEDICRTAHFPLLNPFDFADLEALAKHDFTTDLHSDVVDAILKGLVRELLGVFWRHVSVENVTKVRSLERHNEALQGRMQTLEYHLSDRSRQLSNCRFAYFLEITHLRNQVYIKAREGEKFEAVEAYFFDPTEFLEEELRTQLNDKINLSVKVYADKLRELQRINEDLEMKLESAGGEFRFDPQKGKVEDLIRPVVTKFGVKKCIEALNGESERDVSEFARDWAIKHGWHRQSSSGGDADELESLRQAAKAYEKEAAKLREVLARAQEELQEEQRERSYLQDQLDRANDSAAHSLAPAQPSKARSDDRRPTQPIPVQAQSLGDVEQMDALRKQIARLRLDMEKLSERTMAAEKEMAEHQAAAAAAEEALQSLQDKYNTDVKKARAEAARASAAGAAAAAASGQPVHVPPEMPSVSDDGDDEHDFAKDYEASRKALEQLHKDYSNRRPSRWTDPDGQQSRRNTVSALGLSNEVEDQSRGSRRQSNISDGGRRNSRSEAPGKRGSGPGSGSPKRPGFKKTVTVSLESTVQEIEQGSDDEPGGASAASPSSRRGSRKSVGFLHNLVEETNELLRKAHEEIAALESKLTEMEDEAKEAQVALEEATADAAAARAAAVGRIGSRPPSAKISARVSRPASAKSMYDEEMQVSPEMISGFSETVGRRVASSTGGFECETQTYITGAWDGGFYLLEFPPTDAQLAIEVELEDLNACAMGNWEATLEQIRASQRPPLGHGSGYCPRGAFLRLFQGTRQRISRMDELIQMAEKLKRAELLRMLEGVHLLMESTLPDEDVAMREAIFGRGITEANLVAAKSGMECQVLSKRWGNHASRVISILLQRPEDVELGVHLGRRTFMVGGGAGGSSRLAGGGAGGGLAARERKDFSPPRHAPFPGLLEEDDEMRELQSLSAGGFDPAAASAVGHGAAGLGSQHRRESLALSGHEIPLYNLEGNSIMMTGFNCVDGPYIMIGGRLVPRGGLPVQSRHGSPAKYGRDRSPVPKDAPNLYISARSCQPDAAECRVRSPPGRAMPVSPGGAGGGIRRGAGRSPSSPGRAESPAEMESVGVSAVLADNLVRGAGLQQLPSRQNKLRTLPSLIGRDGLRRASPERGQAGVASDFSSAEVLAGVGINIPTGLDTKPASPQSVSAGTQAEPAPENELGSSQSLMSVQQVEFSSKFAKISNDTPKSRVQALLSNSRLNSRPQTPLDMEEPQAEPAPALHSPALLGSGSTSGSLRRAQSGPAVGKDDARVERDLERERQKLCAGRETGPVPSWLLEQQERAQRGAGGRHTLTGMRPDQRGQDLLKRTASAGRVRPGSASGIGRSASSSSFDGITSRRLAATAVVKPGSSVKQSSSRPGTAVGGRRPSTGGVDASVGKRPAVRITSLPVVST